MEVVEVLEENQERPLVRVHGSTQEAVEVRNRHNITKGRGNGGARLQTYLKKQEYSAHDKRHGFQTLLHEDAGDQPANCPKGQLVRIREPRWIWEGLLRVISIDIEVW